jgi:fructan beta-fructosidase
MSTRSRNQTATARRRGGATDFTFLTALLIATWTGAAHAGNQLYDEPFRPQFHFTPASNWMNDPNGLVYYKGEYHLFYQNNPFGDEWGHMSWGHAVSRDLVHWQHLAVAIPEENGVMIFSGSAVVDWNNSSGLCKSLSRTDHSCLIAVYTGYTGKEQNQSLAYSNKRGRTWTKYYGNPIIDLHLADFRDPKVFRDESRHRWVMVTALSPQHKVRFFGSTDIKHWTALSDFGPAGAVGGAWECPDLFQLPVEGEPGEMRWVLSVNVNPGGVAGGSGNQYFVGQFDGTRFTNENSSDARLWADYGKDFYASTSFSDIPASDGRRIWMGWLDNWEYAAQAPTSPWRGQQTIPRLLRLRRTWRGIRLVQEPVVEMQTLRERRASIKNQSAEAANSLLQSKGVKGDALEIEAEVDQGSATECGFKVRKGASEKTVIGIDWVKSVLFVDRSHSGNTSFHPKFSGRQAAPLNLTGGRTIKLRIFIDLCSVEVFANGGEAVISDLVFPSPASQGIELYSKGGKATVLNLDIWNLKSAVPKRH